GERSSREADGLVSPADEVHLDAAFGFVVEGVVAELPQVEVGPEFAVDVGQEVEVEGGRDPPGVVVGRLEDGAVLLEIGGEQQAAGGADDPGDVGEQIGRLGRAEVADGRAGKVDDAVRGRRGRGR